MQLHIKDRIKLSPFADNMVLYQESRKSMIKLTRIIKELDEVADIKLSCKVNILYITNNKLEGK